jgi:hypothetical protein
MTGSRAGRDSIDRLRTRIGAIRREAEALAATTRPKTRKPVDDALADLLTAEDRLKRPLDSIELENLDVWLVLVKARVEALKRMGLVDISPSSSPNRAALAKPGD